MNQKKIKEALQPSYILILLLGTVLLAYFVSLLLQSSQYSIHSHFFQLNVIPFVMIAVATFLFLSLLWWLDSKFLSRRFDLDVSYARRLDLLSYTPLFSLVVLPAANFRYITNADFSARIELFGLAVLLGIVYIKAVTRYRLGLEGSPILPNFRQKISALSLKKKMTILFLITLLGFNMGSILMRSGGISFSGDEPHYLLITHSLLKDGDFNLKNNYENQDYKAYMPEGVTLDIHIAPGTGGHSYHSPGVSLLLLPFYALGILVSKGAVYYFVRFGMSVFGALLGLQIYLYAKQEWKNEKAAVVLWLLFCFTTPIFFHSLHVYPEIILALFSLTIFRMLRFTFPLTKPKLVFIGILLGSFLWLHAVKYMFILIPFVLYILWVLLKERRLRRYLFYFLGPPVFLTLLHTLFSYTLYGSLSPFSVSLKGTTPSSESLSMIKEVFTDVPLKFRLESLIGYFFDQRDGLLFYSPIYVFGFLGMIELGKRNIKKLLTLLFLAAPYILGLAFLTQRGAYSPQARTQVAVFWVMGVFLGYFLVYNAKKIFLYIFSGMMAFSYASVLVLLRNPWALYQPTTSGETQRAGLMFLRLSNLHISLPQFLPSFIKVDNRGWLPNYVWIGAFFLFCIAFVLIRKHDFRPGMSFHVILVYLALIVVFVCGTLFPRFILDTPKNVTLSTGDKLTFYSLGGVLRMPQPGYFHLPRGDRSYSIFFTSWRPIGSFQIDFGSSSGVFDVSIDYFDQSVFDGQTKKEMKSIQVSASSAYRFKKRYLYQINIALKKESGFLAYSHPFLFSLSTISPP